MTTDKIWLDGTLGVDERIMALSLWIGARMFPLANNLIHALAEEIDDPLKLIAILNKWNEKNETDPILTNEPAVSVVLQELFDHLADESAVAFLAMLGEMD